MKINEHTSIIAPSILLVPYSAHHVPTYHEWMQDEEIQKATASEPLTLSEEYSMQHSWRSDKDKLTFIVCMHDGEEYRDDNMECAQTHSIVPGKQDAPENMIGDVNLFIYDYEEDEDDGENDADEKTERGVVGELEIMIARRDQQGKGMAQETLRVFMSYVQSSLDGILLEFAAGKSVVLRYLRVRIDKDNVRSLRLFERVGFVRTSAEPNYFGEVELRTPVTEGKMRDVERKVGLKGFGRTVRYGVKGHGDT